MRIRVLSDLHLEFKDWKPPKADADVVVLAGDIHVGVKGIEWARRSFPSIRIVYVAGNHEFYGEHIQDMTEELLMEGRRWGVDVLDARSAVIGGVRFLGATLWTDFALATKQGASWISMRICTITGPGTMTRFSGGLSPKIPSGSPPASTSTPMPTITPSTTTIPAAEMYP